MESASVPQTCDPKPNDPHGVPRADGELARAYEQIKSAHEELARLDQLVSGMEPGSDSPPIRQEQEDVASGRQDAAMNEAPAPENQSRRPDGPRAGRPMLRGIVGLLLAIGIVGAAFASRYGHEAKAIMARWAPQVSTASQESPEAGDPMRSLTVRVADTAEQPSPPATPSRREAAEVPSTGATTSSADLAQSLKTIAHDLASINEKLDQLKNSHEKTLRDHADAIQQLRAAQEQSARDNARLTEQVQALQTQLAASSAKSSAPGAIKDTSAVARQHVPVATPRRLRRPHPPWMPPPDMIEPWDYPDW
jgi:hypothetical protein